MKTLIFTEWLKMRKYNAFWWILGITAVSYPGINYIFYAAFQDITSQPGQASTYAKMALGNPFSFPEVWHSVAFFSSLFVFIPAVVVIMFISNEYSFKTHRQNIIDGWSRDRFISSKLMDVLMITLLITILYFLVALIAGLINQERLIKNTWGQAYYTGLFALQTFAQLSIAFLIGFLVRKAFLALGIFLFYYIVLENLLVGWLSWKKVAAASYFPLEISDRLIPKPGFWYLTNPSAYQKDLDAVPLHILLSVLLTAFIWFFCYWLNRRRDLK
jgi:ABC-2 type transport system permease protein